MKRKGHPTLAICNVVGSTIAQEADGGVYLHAGPEIGVASTKAYTSQVAVLAMLALYFGRLRHLSFEAGKRIIGELRKLPDLMRQTLEVNNEVRQLAGKYCHATNFLYLGRQFNFPTALEGALKLKEISYIHAEGYPAAEMKHGPIALVDENTPSVFIMPQGFVYDKVMSNLEEIKARGGPVIAIAAEGDKDVGRLADDVIYVPPRRGVPLAARQHHPAAAPRLSHRRPPRLRRRQAAQPGQERDGGIASFVSCAKRECATNHARGHSAAAVNGLWRSRATRHFPARRRPAAIHRRPRRHPLAGHRPRCRWPEIQSENPRARLPACRL